MSFLSIAHSDVGIKKKTNQDAVLIKEADTDYGKVLLAVICDGMGGLAKGEVASASLIRAFSFWFDTVLPELIYGGGRETLDGNALQKSWNELIDDVNNRISEYAKGFHTSCGTTVVGLLLAGGVYYIINVGDSRVYHWKRKQQGTEKADGAMQERGGDTIQAQGTAVLQAGAHPAYDFLQLTKDQTYVRREIDSGRMTEEEAKNHPRKNTLLQCVGASPYVIPEFVKGGYRQEELFLLCSDGFRHMISGEEFVKIIVPPNLTEENELKDMAVYCTELNKQRNETDNISVVMIKVV